MATADSVKTKIQGLIDSANSATGRSDADMTSAVNALISGYNPNGITPSSTINITSNGTYNVTNYASANVNVPTGTTPSGTINITTNGTHDVTNYASAVVNVPSSAEKVVVRTVTIPSDYGNGTNTTQTILTADEFVKAHYADNTFSAMLVPAPLVASGTGNIVHSLFHCNYSIGSSDVARYGFMYRSTAAGSISMMAVSTKLNGNGYNVSMRAKSTGNMDIYVASGYILKAGTYTLILSCTD